MTTKSIIRRIGSLFMLGVFLWFYSVKDIHDIVHGDDFHCHVKDAKHFHPGEHHCPVCDVLLPYFDNHKPDIKIPSLHFAVTIEQFNLIQAVVGKQVALYSSRAPPIA